MNEGYLRLIKAIFGYQDITVPPYKNFEIIDEAKLVEACDKAIGTLSDKQKKVSNEVFFEGKEKTDENKYDLGDALIALRHPKNSKPINEFIKKVEY